jgi:cellobiose-specific phosphotransferase system component IIC
MGFQVFNIFMGIIAGYYYGRRIICKKIISTQREALIKKVSLFTALIMLLICISPALLALNEKTIGEELQNMLGLNFIPSRGLIISGIILGGITLIIFQYLITRTVQIKTVRANSD